MKKPTTITKPAGLDSRALARTTGGLRVVEPPTPPPPPPEPFPPLPGSDKDPGY